LHIIQIDFYKFQFKFVLCLNLFNGFKLGIRIICSQALFQMGKVSLACNPRIFLINSLGSAHRFVNSIEIHRKFFRTSLMERFDPNFKFKVLLHGK
jgi:hypothetical protein